MKKIAILILLSVSLSANAFWSKDVDYMGYDDNGIFGYNPYSVMNPQWYFEEFENMMDEFGGNNFNDNYYGAYRPYTNNIFGPNGYEFPIDSYTERKPPWWVANTIPDYMSSTAK